MTSQQLPPPPPNPAAPAVGSAPRAAFSGGRPVRARPGLGPAKAGGVSGSLPRFGGAPGAQGRGGFSVPAAFRLLVLDREAFGNGASLTRKAASPLCSGRRGSADSYSQNEREDPALPSANALPGAGRGPTPVSAAQPRRVPVVREGHPLQAAPPQNGGAQRSEAPHSSAWRNQEVGQWDWWGSELLGTAGAFPSLFAPARWRHPQHLWVWGGCLGRGQAWKASLERAGREAAPVLWALPGSMFWKVYGPLTGGRLSTPLPQARPLAFPPPDRLFSACQPPLLPREKLSLAFSCPIQQKMQLPTKGLWGEGSLWAPGLCPAIFCRSHSRAPRGGGRELCSQAGPSPSRGPLPGRCCRSEEADAASGTENNGGAHGWCSWKQPCTARNSCCPQGSRYGAWETRAEPGVEPPPKTGGCLGAPWGFSSQGPPHGSCTPFRSPPGRRDEVTRPFSIFSHL